MRKAARFALALLGAAIVVALAVAPAAQARSGPLQSALERITADPAGPPGISVLIRRHDRDRFIRSGEANVDAGTPPNPRLRMRIASMSKAFNGAVVLALVDRGKLKLDDTIGEVLPRLWPKAGNVNVAQMLRHTADLPDYIHDRAFIKKLKADPAQYMTPRELIGFVSEKKPKHEPGEVYRYSDSDNVVLALMAERVTGRSYESLLGRLVNHPARQRRTTLPKTIAMTRPYLHGYDVPDSGPPEDVSEYINPALAWASGGIVSTPRDVGRFFRAYVGGKLFSRDVQRRQLRFVKGESSPPGPGTNASGLGVFRYRTRCGTVFGHTGSFPGYRLFAAATRNGKRSVVFSVNAQIVPPDQGDQRIARSIRRAQETAVCRMLR